MERKSLRVGGLVILGAVLVRLLAGGIGSVLPRSIAAWVIFAETGRWPQSQTPEQTQQAQTEVPSQTVMETEQALPVFSQSDAGLIGLHNTSSLEPDLEALLAMPLNWQLRGEGVKVLILHTHACESYADSGAYRSTSPQENMLAVGEALAQRLSQAGIGVIHDRTLHDRDSYDGAYDTARQTAQAWLETYPEICLVLDLHRDAVEDSQGNQLPLVLEVEGKQTARLMLVLGMGYSWQENPHWQANLALGVKLQVQLERIAPGICRPLCLRGYRYNQDLTEGCLLIEVGAAGNTLEQALNGADILADAICALAEGTQ